MHHVVLKHFRLGQRDLILDKNTGRVAFPAALPGQHLTPGTINTQMTTNESDVRKLSMVAVKKATQVRRLVHC